MQPAYAPGDRIVVRRWGRPSRGEVVALTSPSEGLTVLKRVIAVGGDQVAVRDRRVFVHGRPLTSAERTVGDTLCVEESIAGRRYAASYARDVAPFDVEPSRVPDGHVYVLGDNRDRSQDSRFFGPVSMDAVLGVVSEPVVAVADRGPCAVPRP